MDAVKKLVHEGNVRRVIIKHDGHTIAEFPLTVGVLGAVLAPMLAAIAAIAAAVKECTIEVERAEKPSAAQGRGLRRRLHLAAAALAFAGIAAHLVFTRPVLRTPADIPLLVVLALAGAPLVLGLVRRACTGTSAPITSPASPSSRPCCSTNTSRAPSSS